MCPYLTKHKKYNVPLCEVSGDNNFTTPTGLPDCAEEYRKCFRYKCHSRRTKKAASV